MLPTFPDRLLDFAVDGVIPASSLHRVADEQATLAFARRHAARERDQARAEAAGLRREAAEAGFHAGLVQALACFVPVMESLRDQQAVLAAAVAAELDAVLQRMNGAPDIVAEQVRAALATHLQPATSSARPTLHVPQDRPGLLEALRGAPGLAGLDVRAAARGAPLLEIGALAWELDLQAALADDGDRAMAATMPGIEDALNALAGQYATQLTAHLDRAAQARGFALLKDVP